MTLGIQVRLLISWHEYVQYYYEVHAYVTQRPTKLTKVYTNTLVITMLKNIFLLHTQVETHDTCHQYSQKYIPILY